MMLRILSFLTCVHLWLCSPSIIYAKADADTSLTASSIFFDRLEQWLFFGRKPTCVLEAERISSSTKSINDAMCWLLYEDRARLIDDQRRDTFERHLGLVPFEEVGLKNRSDVFEYEPLGAFTRSRRVVLHRLPNVDAGKAVRLRVTVPPSKKKHIIALTVKGSVNVYLDSEPLTPMENNAAFFLDNQIYELAPTRKSRKLSVHFLPSDGTRILSARMLSLGSPTVQSIVKPKDKALSPVDTHLWWDVLWRIYHDDAGDDVEMETWLDGKLDSDSPWRYGLALIRLSRLQRIVPHLHRRPFTADKLALWYQFQFELGLHHLSHGRLSLAWQVLTRLRRSEAPDELSRKLYAELLDDAGLHGAAASLIPSETSDRGWASLRLRYLLGAGFNRQAREIVYAMAQGPDATRDDVRTWLGWLYRAGRYQAFRDARKSSLHRCPSCWQTFEAFGGLSYPRMPIEDLPDDLKAHVRQEEILVKPIGVTRDDEWFTRQELQTVKDVDFAREQTRNLMLHYALSDNRLGGHQLRERRIVQVGAKATQAQLTFSLPYIPSEQHIQIRRAQINRPGVGTLFPVESDDTAHDPTAKLFFDTRLRTLTFRHLRPDDRIELDWSVVDHGQDEDHDHLDGWQIPIVDQMPTVSFSVDWRRARSSILGYLDDGQALPDRIWQDRHVAMSTEKMNERSQFLILAETDDWQEFQQAYQNLIKQRLKSTPLIAEEARRLTNGLGTDAEKLLAIFRFVKGQIEYVGLEYAEHRHIPEFAERVLRRKLGDCKDQAALLIALAEAVGVKVDMVLVRSHNQPKITHLQPTLALFDHAIVYANSLNMYLDPSQQNLFGVELSPEIQGAQALILNESAARVRLPVLPKATDLMAWRISYDDTDSESLQVTVHLSETIKGLSTIHNALDGPLLSLLSPMGQKSSSPVLGGTISDEGPQQALKRIVSSIIHVLNGQRDPKDAQRFSIDFPSHWRIDAVLPQPQNGENWTLFFTGDAPKERARFIFVVSPQNSSSQVENTLPTVEHIVRYLRGGGR